MNRPIFISILLSFWALIFFSGCANPVNKVTFNNYYQSGMAAEEALDYKTARENYYRALVNVDIGNLSPQNEAAASYSLGRMMGIFCNPERAEELLLRAYKLDKEHSGPIHMTLIELARLNYDLGKYQNAIKFCEEVTPIIDKSEYLKSKDPIAFAQFFDEYADALKKTGKEQEAQKIIKKANQLRLNSHNKKAIGNRTPFMKHCE